MSGFASTIADDWRVIDGTVTVTYYPRTAENAFGPGVTVQGAEGTDGSKEEKLAAGALASEVTTKWTLWVTQLGGITPKANDRIVDPAGVAWLVRALDNPPLYTFWELTCVKAR